MSQQAPNTVVEVLNPLRLIHLSSDVTPTQTFREMMDLKVTLPLKFRTEIPLRERAYIRTKSNMVVGVQASLMVRPKRDVFLCDSEDLPCCVINWEEDNVTIENQGANPKSELITVSTPGAVGFHQVLLAKQALNTRSLDAIWNTVEKCVSKNSSDIHFDKRTYSRRFYELADGNENLVGKWRDEKKAEWFCRMADLNHSIKWFKYFSAFIQGRLMREEEVCNSIYCVQELLAQLAVRNIGAVVGTSCEICSSDHPEFDALFCMLQEIYLVQKPASRG